eukprot:gene9114-6553_t
MQGKFVENDDFCDELTFGSDEFNTSACSFYQNEPNYHGDSTADVGVCDCCDGRDEDGGPFAGKCPNTCGEKLVTLRKEALVNYRNIQAGTRAKSELLTQWRQRKNHDVQSFESLKQDRQHLIDYLKMAKYLLKYKEMEREDEMRWILIREREYRCANGDLAACNFFHPVYLTDDELITYDQPSIIKNNEDGDGEDEDRGGSGHNRRTKKKYQKRFVYEYTAQELDAFKRASGVQRVRTAICPQPDLLPDETSRIFVRFDEYYDYMVNHALKQARVKHARSERRMSMRRFRKYNTLFGRYLEDGEWGYITAAITASEWLGLLLSPVSLLYRGWNYATEMSGLYLWDLTERCHRDLDTFVPPVDADNLERDGLLTIYGRYVLRWVQRGLAFILDAEVDGSFTAQVISALDYTQYSFLATRVEALYENLKTFFWVADIAYHAPVVYFEYYVQGKYQQLPQKRHACVLRQAIQQCETELDRLRTMLQQENEAQSLKAKSVEEALIFKRQTATKRAITTTASTTAATTTTARVAIDFGVDQAWESMAQQCTWTTSFGTYNYTFCLFDEIKQDGHTSMGLFRHWGTSPAATNNYAKGFSSVHDMPLLHQYLQRVQFQAKQQAALATTSSFTSSSSYVDLQGLVHSLTQELPTTMTELVLRSWNVSESWMDAQKEAWSSSNITVVQAMGQWLRQHIPSGLHLSDEERHALLQEQLQHYYQHQWYDLGTPCPVKPSLRRTTEVTLVCGQQFAIVRVEEASICEYRMTVTVPLACDTILEQQALRRLEELKVFGFKKK